MNTPKRTRKKPTSSGTASTAPAKKPRRTNAQSAPSAARPRARSAAASSRKRTRTAKAAPEPVAVEVASPTPTLLAPEVIAPEPAAPADGDTIIVTSIPEPMLAARVPAPEPPRPRPDTRRGIFFDVENTSRAADIARVLSHIALDWTGQATEFFAVGNWRVIGHDTARLLARHGAALVHSAPSVGVRDWSDLRIAVAAGVWLASGRPGDVIEIVSDDQAFDAVGDVAASLGLTFRRTSYRALAGLAEQTPAVDEAGDARRRSRRGGRGRRGERERVERHRGERERTDRERSDRRGERERAAAERVRVPRPEPVAEPPPDTGAEPHTAPHDEIVHVVRDLLVDSPAGITLDTLANALRSRGFSRPPGSPRLITRLRRIRELEIGRNGLIRIGDVGGHARTQHERAAHRGDAAGSAARGAGAAASGRVHGGTDAEWEAWAREAEARDAAREGEAGARDDDEEAATAAEQPQSLPTRADLAHPLEAAVDDDAAEEGVEAAAEDDEGAGTEGDEGSEAGDDTTPDANGSGGRRRRRRGGRRRRGRRGGGQSLAPAADGA